jgi:hypothetical protein
MIRITEVGNREDTRAYWNEERKGTEKGRAREAREGKGCGEERGPKFAAQHARMVETEGLWGKCRALELEEEVAGSSEGGMWRPRPRWRKVGRGGQEDQATSKGVRDEDEVDMRREEGGVGGLGVCRRQVRLGGATSRAASGEASPDRVSTAKKVKYLKF